MKFSFEEIKKIIKGFNTYQKIASGVLAVAIPASLAMGSVSAVSISKSGLIATNMNNPSSSFITSIISAVSGESQTPEEPKDVTVQLKVSSVEEDLEVQVTDEKGRLIIGPEFVVNVKSAKGSYNREWPVDDGFLKLTKLSAGDYVVTIRPKDNYIRPDSVSVSVKAKVAYKQIDISSIVVDESKIDVSKEDAAYGTVAPTKPAEPQNTVEYVPPTVVEEVKPIEPDKIVYRYVANTNADGRIYKKDGVTLSDIYAIKDADGYIIGAYTLEAASNVPSLSMFAWRMPLNFIAFADDENPSEIPPEAPRHEHTWAETSRTESTCSVKGTVTLTCTVCSETKTEELPLKEHSYGVAEITESTCTKNGTKKEICSVCGDVQTIELPLAEHKYGAPTVLTPATCTTAGTQKSVCDVCKKEITSEIPATGHELDKGTVTQEPTETQEGVKTFKCTVAGCDYTKTEAIKKLDHVHKWDKGTITIEPTFNSEGEKVFKCSGCSEVKKEVVPKIEGVRKDYNLFNANGSIKENILAELDIRDRTVTQQTVTIRTGWQDIDGARYYFDKNGNKVTGTQTIEGITYFFDSNGKMSNRIGVDVSKYQRTIDWGAVKNAGVDFAIIRVGYRGYGSGALVEDPAFKRNIQGATAAGIKVGVYFFSQAITTQEAVEEASMCLQYTAGYGLSLPIFFDSEYSTSRKDGRADGLSKSQRTAIAQAFCETVRSGGRRAGVYASKSWFYGQLDYSRLRGYDIWVAHYTSRTDFAYRYDIWQYTGSGSIAGISTAVDLNIGYKAY